MTPEPPTAPAPRRRPSPALFAPSFLAGILLPHLGDDTPYGPLALLFVTGLLAVPVVHIITLMREDRR